VRLQRFKNPAIIFGPAPITGLGVARNLGRNGIDVYCVAESKNEIAYSRYCKKFYAVHQIEKDKNVLRDFLSNIKKKLKHPAVIFPCSDLFCVSLSQLREEPNSILNDQYVTFGESTAIETLVNKRKFYHSLDKYGVPHPKTFFPENLEDVEHISRQVEYPVFIKPAITQLFAMFRKKGLVAHSRTELITLYELVSKHSIDVVIQEIIPGPATNLFGLCGYFNKKYEPQAFFAYRRIREYPLMFGTNTIIESIPTRDVLSMKNVVENYLRKIRYHGIFEAEFKKDPRNGDFKLLEINARSWWQNSFPTKCGINIVLMAYLDAIGEEINYSENYSYRTGVKWLFFINDIFSSMELLSRRQINVYEWLSTYTKIRDFAYLAVDDPLPWIMSLIYISRSYAKTLRTKVFTRPFEILSGRGDEKSKGTF
jgi:predicted ATP-grasp superfamily ATP-dependent carboligase